MKASALQKRKCRNPVPRQRVISEMTPNSYSLPFLSEATLCIHEQNGEASWTDDEWADGITAEKGTGGYEIKFY